MARGSAGSEAIVVERQRLGRKREFAALVRLNRPDALNPIDWAMVRALDGVISEIAGDRSVRAVLLTGNGRAFSAGGDLKSYVKLQRDPVGFPQFVADLHARVRPSAGAAGSGDRARQRGHRGGWTRARPQLRLRARWRARPASATPT